MLMWLSLYRLELPPLVGECNSESVDNGPTGPKSGGMVDVPPSFSNHVFLDPPFTMTSNAA